MREYVAVVSLLQPVLQKGRSFDSGRVPSATPLAREIAFGVLRHYFRLDAILGKLLSKPLHDKHLDVRILLLAGLYSVDAIRRPAYTSVNDAVESAGTLGKPWAKGMVNGVLRNYLRRKDEILASLAGNREAQTNHPAWLRDAIHHAWPAKADDIIAANNTQAPMTLRVNQALTTTEAMIARLQEAGIASHPGKLNPQALYLESPRATDDLPGFAEGCVSVQDEASQLAAALLEAGEGMRVLDACAAPGGKTCHLLEREPELALTAVDIDEGRLRQVRQNLTRLHLTCKLAATDLRAFKPSSTFHRILLDAPCSATGIIRRHPDIKLLRRQSDIAKLVATQTELIKTAWQLLEPGGVLLYSTCSILPAENEAVVAGFLEHQTDAAPHRIPADWGIDTGIGRQLLPEIDGHDGFYYARLVKQS